MPLTRAELNAWISELRAHPEQQLTGSLTNDDYTKFCCLGKLCEVQGVSRVRVRDCSGYRGEHDFLYQTWKLPARLAAKFGAGDGNFTLLRMPNLHNYDSAAAANDAGVSWALIADHFEKYYKCSDDPAPAP